MSWELLIEHIGLFALAGGGAGLLQLPVLLFLGLSFSVAQATHENGYRRAAALGQGSAPPCHLKRPES